MFEEEFGIAAQAADIGLENVTFTSQYSIFSEDGDLFILHPSTAFWTFTPQTLHIPRLVGFFF